MAKMGDFASIPDEIFDELVVQYTSGTFGVAQDRIDGLAALAKAAHASTTATKEPHVVTLTLLCMDINRQFDILKANPAGAARTLAITDLLADVKRLGGLWR